MQKTLSILLLLALVAYTAACLALFLLQRSLIYFLRRKLPSRPRR
ncbi:MULTISPECIES: hypothetical protein [unclassified Massilia]|nr:MULTISPECIES: hypothetical protein [unclassified Massilia]